MENQVFPKDAGLSWLILYPQTGSILPLRASQQMGEPGLLQTCQEGGEELEGRE